MSVGPSGLPSNSSFLARSLKVLKYITWYYEQDVEKIIRDEVAAGLPRHILNVCNRGWGPRAAATPFFNKLLKFARSH